MSLRRPSKQQPEKFEFNSTSLKAAKTIIAKSGYILKRNEKNILILYNGTIQTEKKNGKINFLNFKKTEINLSSFRTKTTTIPKIQEKDTLSLLNCITPFLESNKATVEDIQCKRNRD